LQFGYSLALAQAKEWMQDEDRQLRASIAADVEALAVELLQARAELAVAREEVAQLRALMKVAPASARLH
jgi:hypothetical protein